MSTSATKRAITVLGTGRMGAALARAFLNAGHRVTVWNRTPARAAPLAEHGARVAATVADAVSGAELVVGNVSDYAASRAILNDPAVTEALRGTIYVELASGIPSHARAAETWARERRIAYLDGAIMATPDFIGMPECTLLYAGAEDVFERARPLLAALGGDQRFLGSVIGHANALDNALLMVLWGSVFGLMQGTAVAEAEQFPLDAFLAALGATFPVIQATLQDAVPRIAARRFEADETSAATVEVCHASVRYLVALGREHGLALDLPLALDRLFQRARDAGHAQSDVSAVYGAVRSG